MKHINPDQLNELTALLRLREEELKAELDHYLHDANGSGGMQFANHSETAGDRVEATVMANDDIAMARHDLLELYDIKEALQRIENRSYGVCVQCGEDIPVARLFAQPATLFCVACQSQLEKTSGLDFRLAI